MSNVHSVFIGPTYLMAVNTILVLYYNSIGAEHFLLLKGHIKLFQPSKFGLGLMFDLKIMNNLSHLLLWNDLLFVKTETVNKKR